MLAAVVLGISCCCARKDTASITRTASAPANARTDRATRDDDFMVRPPQSMREKTKCSLCRNGGCGLEPTLHLIVVHQTRLLHYCAASRENHEVGDAADLEAPCDVRVFFRIHFQHDRFARHVRSGARDFGRG